VAATAIVVPVPAVDPAVSLWRRAYTTDGAEGMHAHVTLIYPFVAASHLDGAVTAGLRGALDGFAPFDVRFGSFGRFDADPPVLYLEPDAAAPFRELIAAIAARFPEHPPFGGVHDAVIPHLTVAYADDPTVLAAAETDVARRLPLSAHVDTVDVMEHRPAAGWRVRARTPLGHR
jgi:2'-5' RNA ligase